MCVVVQSLSCVWLCATPWHAARQASLSFTISQNLHLILCRPLLLLPSIFPSIRVFSSESALCIRWPKYWSFSFSISPSSQYSELISFRINWFDLLAVQWRIFSSTTVWKHQLQQSAFFMVQLSHPCMIIGKTIALTIWTFVGKVMSLLFNMLSKLVTAFLPRSKCLLISWVQSPSTVTFKVKVKVKSLSRVQLFATLWTVAYQAPLSMGFSRQEYWSGVPFPSPGDLPDTGIKPRSPTL